MARSSSGSASIKLAASSGPAKRSRRPRTAGRRIPVAGLTASSPRSTARWKTTRRHQRVSDRRRVPLLREQPVGQVLQVGPRDLGQPDGAEVVEHVKPHRRRVPAGGARLVNVAGAGADRARQCARLPGLQASRPPGLQASRPPRPRGASAGWPPSGFACGPRRRRRRAKTSARPVSGTSCGSFACCGGRRPTLPTTCRADGCRSV
jgi:hypothetical protein